MTKSNTKNTKNTKPRKAKKTKKTRKAKIYDELKENSVSFNNLHKCLHAAQRLALDDRVSVTFNNPKSNIQSSQKYFELEYIEFQSNKVNIFYSPNGTGLIIHKTTLDLQNDDFDFIIYPKNAKRIVLLT